MVLDSSDDSWRAEGERIVELHNELNRAQAAQLDEEPPFVAPIRTDPKRSGIG